MHNTRVESGEMVHVVDAGGVVLRKGAEVLTGAIVQKSYFCGYTEVGEYAKVSNQTIIGHGSKIGNRTLIAGNCTVAGFNTIGCDVWIGPNSVLGHGLSVANEASVKMGSVVVKNVGVGEEVSGNFAYSHPKRLKNHARNTR